MEHIYYRRMSFPPNQCSDFASVYHISCRNKKYILIVVMTSFILSIFPSFGRSVNLIIEWAATNLAHV